MEVTEQANQLCSKNMVDLKINTLLNIKYGYVEEWDADSGNKTHFGFAGEIEVGIIVKAKPSFLKNQSFLLVPNIDFFLIEPTIASIGLKVGYEYEILTLLLESGIQAPFYKNIPYSVTPTFGVEIAFWDQMFSVEAESNFQNQLTAMFGINVASCLNKLFEQDGPQLNKTKEKAKTLIKLPTTEPSIQICQSNGNCVMDLLSVYKQKPSEQEIQDIQNDFDIAWLDNSTSDLTWPSVFDFDQASGQASKTVIISRLNILKKQKFSESLPFTDLSIYDYVKKNTKEIQIGLTNDYNRSDTNGKITLNYSSALWNASLSYISGLQLIVHETRHNEPGDPRHVSCGIPAGNDEYFENGSGYAYAAMYLMWVYKYSMNDPQSIKEKAKNAATSLLKDRFCNPPTHSNPKVQAIIDELLYPSSK